MRATPPSAASTSTSRTPQFVPRQPLPGAFSIQADDLMAQWQHLTFFTQLVTLFIDSNRKEYEEQSINV
jgi:hypothetical protein